MSIRNQGLGFCFLLKTFQMVVLPSWWNGAPPRGQVGAEYIGSVMHDIYQNKSGNSISSGFNSILKEMVKK